MVKRSMHLIRTKICGYTNLFKSIMMNKKNKSIIIQYINRIYDYI